MVSYEIPKHRCGVSMDYGFRDLTVSYYDQTDNISLTLYSRALAASAPILQFPGMTPCEVRYSKHARENSKHVFSGVENTLVIDFIEMDLAD